MDAIKFLEEYKRMCDSFEHCSDCSLLTEDCDNFKNPEFVEKAVVVVEEWSAAHPRKTRQSVFLEQYPNARIDSQAVIYVCPADAYGDKVCPKNEENFHMLCCDCRREFWGQEAE